MPPVMSTEQFSFWVEYVHSQCEPKDFFYISFQM